MRTITKKLLALFLCVCMIGSAFTLSGFASDTASDANLVAGAPQEMTGQSDDAETIPRKADAQSCEAQDDSDKDDGEPQDDGEEDTSGLPGGILGKALKRVAQGLSALLGLPLVALIELFRSPMVLFVIIPLLPIFLWICGG